MSFQQPITLINKMNKKLAIYARVSSEISVGKDNSIPAQEKIGIAKANELKMEYEIFREEGKSAKYEDLLNRPVLEGLLERCDDGEFSGIFVTEMDRLTRNEYSLMLIKKVLIDNEVLLYTISQTTNFKDEEHDFMASLQALLANRENRIKTKRIIRSLHESSLKGKWTGGVMLPYGYMRGKDGMLLINEEEAEIVKQIFAWSLEGKGSNTIANVLNERKVPTRGRKSLKKGIKLKNRYTKKEWHLKNEDIIWRPNTIITIIKNPIYKGERRYKKTTIPSPIIIPAEEWQRTTDHLSKNKAFSDRNNKTHFYLLKGLIRCKKCGNNLFGRIKENRGERCYTCLSKRNGKFCGMKNINIDKLNSLVWNLLIDDEGDDFGTNFWGVVLDLFDKRKNLPEVVNFTKEINFNEKKLIEKKENKDRLLTLYIEGNIEKEDYLKRISKIDEEKREFEKRIRELQQSSNNIQNIEKVDELVYQMRELQKYICFDITEEEKQEIIRKYVKEIRIDFEMEKQFHKVEIEIELMDFESNTLNTTITTHELCTPPIKKKSHHL